jgi:hypothetical protein
VGFFEHSAEPSGSVKFRKFLNDLAYCQLPKKNLLLEVAHKFR